MTAAQYVSQCTETHKSQIIRLREVRHALVDTGVLQALVE